MARSDTWWNNVVMRYFTHQDWLQNFRMCKETFLYICDRLPTELERSDTVMRRSLTVQRRVAVCLWCLATPIEYRTIAHLFGIGRSTVCEIVHETKKRSALIALAITLQSSPPVERRYWVVPTRYYSNAMSPT